MKHHISRAHKNRVIEMPVSESSSCHTTRSRKNRVVEKPVSDSSSCHTTRSCKKRVVEKPIEKPMSDISSFWALYFVVVCLLPCFSVNYCCFLLCVTRLCYSDTSSVLSLLVLSFLLLLCYSYVSVQNYSKRPT